MERPEGWYCEECNSELGDDCPACCTIPDCADCEEYRKELAAIEAAVCNDIQ